MQRTSCGRRGNYIALKAMSKDPNERFILAGFTASANLNG
jgi:hypothetical protein